MNTRLTPARAHFSMKFGQAVAEGVDLDDETDVELVDLPQPDQPIEDRFPLLVASEIVVGDEEAAQTLRVVNAHEFFNVIGRAATRFPALHVDDGAKRALVRAAATGIEAGGAADRAPYAVGSQQRDRRAPERRQVGHEIVERLQAASCGIAEHLIEMA